MTDKEKLMMKHAEWGLIVQPLNAEIVRDCYAVIQGLEEAISNMTKIALMPDSYTAKRALMKELIVISSNTSAMLNRYIPEISEIDTTPF